MRVAAEADRWRRAQRRALRRMPPDTARRLSPAYLYGAQTMFMLKRAYGAPVSTLQVAACRCLLGEDKIDAKSFARASRQTKVLNEPEQSANAKICVSEEDIVVVERSDVAR